jgi:hypothetical protein
MGKMCLQYSLKPLNHLKGTFWKQYSLYCLLQSFLFFLSVLWENLLRNYDINWKDLDKQWLFIMFLNFITAWRTINDTIKRVLIWRFTLVLIKINYGQIGEWSSRTLTKLKLQSQKRFNERKYQYLKYKNKNHSGPDT